MFIYKLSPLKKIFAVLALCTLASLPQAQASDSLDEEKDRPSARYVAQHVASKNWGYFSHAVSYLKHSMRGVLSALSGSLLAEPKKLVILPNELIGVIATYCTDCKISLTNKGIFTITTRFEFKDHMKRGPHNRPSYEAYPCIPDKDLDFKKMNKTQIDALPSYTWYSMVGIMRNIPQDYWPLLQGTHVHTVNFSYTIGDMEAIKFAQYLKNTQVLTVDLKKNFIRAPGAIGFAQHLKGTLVHTVDLSDNGIKAEGAAGFAKNLKGTLVHTVDLSSNNFGDQVAIIGFVQNLKGTQVHTVKFRENWTDDAGAIGFAQHLKGTHVHTVNLSQNKIGDETQSFLREQYSHINWHF